MSGRPGMSELVEAVREFLDGLRPELAGRSAFHARVAANALRVVERELAADPAAAAADRAALAKLAGVPRENPDPEGALCRRIRAGELDDRLATAVQVVAETVRHQLAVDNPRHLC